ncbi:hypothetical protein [Melittangium boletus]|uniref:hypothetical protein n=1 Tax=Melittangium boletus TaxID=83453 RepID=UPI003DA35CD4
MPRMLAPVLCLVPFLALGQTPGAPLAGTAFVVSEGEGDQTDPRLSGTRAVYTNQAARGSSEIRFQDLLTHADAAIPTLGGYDAVADLQGTQVVFTRTTSSSLVYGFDLSRPGAYATELAPRAGADRRTPSVGGHTVAWRSWALPREAPRRRSSSTTGPPRPSPGSRRTRAWTAPPW